MVSELQESIPLTTLFTLIIIIAGNFFQDILPCSFQYEMKHSQFLKYSFLFFTIFFIVLSSPGQTIVYTLLHAFIIFIWFCFYVKNSYRFFIFNTFLLLLISILFLQYKIKSNDILQQTINILLIVSSTTIFIGFLYYMFKKYKKYGKKFNFITFLFGVHTCKYEKLKK